MKTKILKILFGFLVFSFILFAFLLREKFEYFENVAKDCKQKLSLKVWQQRTKKSAVRDSIVILSVDDLTAFDLSNHYPNGSVKWPLSRKDWSSVIDFIEQGRPKVLTLCFAFFNYEDITLSSSSPDLIFSNTLKKYNNIVLGNAFSSTLSSSVQSPAIQPDFQPIKPIKKSLEMQSDTKSMLTLPTYYYFLPVPNLFVNNAHMAFVNLTKDEDNIVRRSQPLSKIVVANQTYVVPSLSFATFLRYIGKEPKISLKDSILRVDSHLIPLDKSASNSINWNGYSRTYNMIPFSKVVIAAMSGQSRFEFDKKLYSPEYFKNKIVIIAPAQTGSDTFKTPVDNEMSIAEINANIIENYINDSNLDNAGRRKFVRTLPNYVSVIAGFAVGLLLIANILLFRLSWLSAFNCILLFIIYLVVNIFAYVNPKIRIDILTVYPVYIMFASMVSAYSFVLYDEKSRKKIIKSIFSQKVSSTILKRLCVDSLDIPKVPTKVKVAVLSCNFANFSQLYSKYDELEVVEKLNRVLNFLTDKILKHNGTINQIQGEKIIAYWGYPVETINSSLCAVKAALDIINDVENDIFDIQSSDFKIDFKISINTGEVIISTIGNGQSKDLVAIGDTVNLTSKIDEIAVQFDKKLLISQTTYKDVENIVKADYAGTLKIKGRDIQLGLYVPRLGKENDKS